MQCHYCGFNSVKQERFCPFCGTRQEPDREEMVSEPVETLIPETGIQWEDVPESELAYEEETAAEAFQEEPAKAVVPAKPEAVPVNRLWLPVRRGLVKMVFLGILTLGIYPTVIWSRIVTELNIAASRYDGERTMPYFAMIILSPITLGIYTLVWFHDFCYRIGAELCRRSLAYQFGPKDFWLWNILGSLILVGPFIFLHKLMKSMNLINGDFNTNG